MDEFEKAVVPNEYVPFAYDPAKMPENTIIPDDIGSNLDSVPVLPVRGFLGRYGVGTVETDEGVIEGVELVGVYITAAVEGFSEEHPQGVVAPVVCLMFETIDSLNEFVQGLVGYVRGVKESSEIGKRLKKVYQEEANG